MEFDVGARLKMIRMERKLSQRELARRAGLTNSAISAIELNRVSPSIASLKKLLQVIPISLSDFFASDPPPAGQIFYRAAELQPLTHGNLMIRQVGGSAPARQLQILHEHYAPGADTGEEMLQHAAQEGGVVIRGQIEVTVGERKQILYPGDAYLFDSREPHRFRNVGVETAEIVSGCTPPYF